ncbi:hypothetical protein VNO80_04934 [Phaseolus coccineus]|uniref:Uncharacterized protein n=1 Tax=Phaseolus coccineus TaxID=3886 RepID=A0AAN9RRZ6_PHACN
MEKTGQLLPRNLEELESYINENHASYWTSSTLGPAQTFILLGLEGLWGLLPVIKPVTPGVGDGAGLSLLVDPLLIFLDDSDRVEIRGNGERVLETSEPSRPDLGGRDFSDVGEGVGHQKLYDCATLLPILLPMLTLNFSQHKLRKTYI